MPNRPDRMWRNGRAVDSEFSLEEKLYHRCVLHQLDYNGETLSSVSVRVPNFSVNRGKHSEPKDVLIPPEDLEIPNIEKMGIVSFLVETAIWQKTPEGSEVSYTFNVEHVPLEDNYSHSEVKSYKNGAYSDKAQINDVVKKEYRARIALGTKILQKPEI